jgi:glycosyltransferase involved in cell wall biosynthesis
MLASRGHEVTVIAAKVHGTKEEEFVDGIHIYRLPCIMMPQLEIAHNFKFLSYTFLPSNLKRLSKIFQEKNFDIINQHGQIFDTALSSTRLAKQFNKPLVITIHTPVRHTVPIYMSILKFLDTTIVKHLIINKCQMLISPDQTTSDNINERYQHSWVEEIPYGVEQLEAKPERGEEIRKKFNLGNRPMILSLGHVHNLRDRCDLIAAMPEIIKHVPDVHLLIVGDIYTQRPVELTKSLNLESHITFTGSVPHEEIGDYLAAATIEAHWLSNAPGLGIAAMEAMAVGKPVVSSIGVDDMGKGMLKPGENIMLIERGSLSNISDTIIKLLSDTTFRQQIGENGRKMIEDHFSWNSVTDKTEIAYQKLIDSFSKP